MGLLKALACSHVWCFDPAIHLIIWTSGSKTMATYLSAIAELGDTIFVFIVSVCGNLSFKFGSFELKSTANFDFFL